MTQVRWGIVGCGDVTEVKSGPALQKAEGSSLVAVMRRDREKAADYASRHQVPRHYDQARLLIGDPDVDAVYIATPPSSHLELALMAAAAGKPCLVEKPMAATYADCLEMVEAFEARRVPLFVAYYRRAQPRFLRARALVREGAIGRPVSAHVFHDEPLLERDAARSWRVDPAVAGGGLFFDLGSHGLDLVEFLLGPIASIAGTATNTGGAYDAEDRVEASFIFESGATGTGLWNFDSDRRGDGIVVSGTSGVMRLPVFSPGPLVLSRNGVEEQLPFDPIPHVHQPFIQSVVDELLGRGRCESDGRSGARASWLMDQCVASYYASRPGLRTRVDR